MEKKIKDNWSLSIGLYPGILLGMRTYEEPKQAVYVIYMPIIDIALTIYDPRIRMDKEIIWYLHLNDLHIYILNIIIN